MTPDPPVNCRTCGHRAECEARKTICPELDKWLDDTYRDHCSVDTPVEHRHTEDK